MCCSCVVRIVHYDSLVSAQPLMWRAHNNLHLYTILTYSVAHGLSDGVWVTDEEHYLRTLLKKKQYKSREKSSWFVYVVRNAGSENITNDITEAMWTYLP